MRVCCLQPPCVPPWWSCKPSDKDPCCPGYACAPTYTGCEVGPYVCQPKAPTCESDQCGGKHGSCCSGELQIMSDDNHFKEFDGQCLPV
jgi:hypothetical protein